MLHEIACVFDRRRKAIGYQARRFECSREEGEDGERLVVDFDGILGLRVDLSIWDDGFMYLRALKAGPKRPGGWAFQREIRSHVAELDGFEICRRFEQTLLSPEEMRKIWPAFSSEAGD